MYLSEKNLVRHRMTITYFYFFNTYIEQLEVVQVLEHRQVALDEVCSQAVLE